MLASPAVSAPWHRLPDEPARWYARFEIYRLLGPARTLEAAFRSIAQLEHLTGSRPGQAWYAAAKDYRWAERAEAWDSAERDRLRALEEDRRFDAREARLSKIDQMLNAVYTVLLTAHLDDLDTDQARAALPQMRLLFAHLLAAQRAELGLPAVADQDHQLTPFTADDLAAAAAELTQWAPPRAISNGNGGSLPRAPHLTALRNALAALYPDETSARRIAQQAGLTLSRIHFANTAADTWHAILYEAEATDCLEDLIAVATSEYGPNRALRLAIKEYRKTGVGNGVSGVSLIF